MSAHNDTAFLRMFLMVLGALVAFTLLARAGELTAVLSSGGSLDCTGNGIPDECEPDCNGNDIADECDIANGPSTDLNENGIPDMCEMAQWDFDGDLESSLRLICNAIHSQASE